MHTYRGYASQYVDIEWLIQSIITAVKLATNKWKHKTPSSSQECHQVPQLQKNSEHATSPSEHILEGNHNHPPTHIESSTIEEAEADDLYHQDENYVGPSSGQVAVTKTGTSCGVDVDWICLPGDLWKHILSFLEPVALAQAQLLSRTFETYVSGLYILFTTLILTLQQRMNYGLH